MKETSGMKPAKKLGWFRGVGGTLLLAGLTLCRPPAWGQAAASAAAQSNAPAQLITVPPEVPANALRYTFLLAGNKAGVMAVWVSPDGARHTFFAFNDRGRGPSITTRIVLDRSGFPTQIDATGNDYLKGPVDEHFRVAGGRATWKNKAEHGEKQLSTPAFYVPLDAVLSNEMETALLAAPGGRLALLPEGEARIEKATERSAEIGGKTQKVTLYEETGLSFTPTQLWLAEDGSLVAAGSEWGAVLREGAESAWPALLEAQKARAGARGEEVARRLARKPAGPLLIVHARLFDSESATVQEGMSVLLSGNRIVAVGPDGNITAPGSEVLDARGKMLLPGLWDMHVHLGNWDDGLLHMAAGVTSVRDMANDIDHLHDLQTKFDAGTLIGPRIVMAGFIDGRGPYQGPTKVFADTPEEAVAQVDRYKSLGYEQIKLYSSLKPELVPVVAAEAHRLGLRLSGHVPAFMTMEQAIQQGYDEVQHANFWFLNFIFDQVQDTRTPARFTAVAEHAAALDLQSARVRAFVQLLQQHHSVVDPTVTVFESMFVARPGTVAPNLAEVAARLPAQIRRATLVGGLPVPEGMDQRYRDSFQAMLRMLKLLYDAGITIVAGTDDLAGFTLHRELENYVAAGIPAPRVLQMATLGAARVMKHDDLRGSIAPGKLADVILVEGDPTARIAEIRRVVTVIKDGTVYDAGALYEELGVRPAN
ncbi:MAG TPA: amidohydrolase family protein [Candidatus Binatia bacterium]|nr:amidohydrolase family protein [Candidatus Binatia bacterium]